ncbi:PDZ and LIM domain protein 2-like, partial [Cyanistes caeruleus]|uniref:PDZ and LIM domain protein 2-like n=1 Tax=Cyanistes caeruleus TaxID=156563 RepID=UPI000CDAE53C
TPVAPGLGWAVPNFRVLFPRPWSPPGRGSGTVLSEPWRSQWVGAPQQGRVRGVLRCTGGSLVPCPLLLEVTEHGKAAMGDLRPGDVIVTINGESTAEMLNVEAQNKIKQSPGQLRLEVERSPVPSPSHTNGDTSPERLATRFQDMLQMQSESQGTLRTLDPGLASLTHPPGSASSQ